MASPALIGLFVAAVALALFWITAYWQIESATGREPHSLWSPWASGAWCASEGNGSPGDPPRAPELTIAELWAFRPVIVRWVVKRGVPESDVEDVVQNIMEGAWNSRHRWDPNDPRCGALSTWLFIIMRNHVNTYQNRAYMRRETTSADPFGLAGLDVPLDPAEAAELRQSSLRAVEILKRIPAHLAVLFTKYEIERAPMPEVAAELGLPMGTAWGQLGQARAMIAREVAREDAIEACRRRWRE